MAFQSLTNGDQDGSLMGRSPAEKIGFYGVNPIAQQGNSNQHLVQRNMGGQIILFASTLADTTAIIGAQTTTTLPLLTVPGVTANDIVLGISKLGYCFPYGYAGGRIVSIDTIEVTGVAPN